MPPRQRYTWDDRLGRYRDAVNGRIVAAAKVRAVIDATLRNLRGEARRLADATRAGKLSREQWALEMREVVRSTHLFSAAAARGGWRNMDDAGYAQVDAVLREQDAFLDRFVADVLTGRQPMDGRFSQRAAMYVEAGRETHSRAQRDVELERGQTEERNILNDRAAHCADCPGESERGWVPIGTLSLPGTRSCLGNCRCRIEYRDGEIVTSVEEEAASEIVEPPVLQVLTGDEAQAMLDLAYQAVTVTDVEADKLRGYSAGDYYEINKALTEGTTPFDPDLVKALDDTIDRVPLPQGVTVYRGVNASTSPTMKAFAGASVDDLQRLVGTQIEGRAFVSTTIRPNVAANFSDNVVMEIRLPQGARAGWVPGLLRGGNEGASTLREQEVILARGARFRVVGVEPSSVTNPKFEPTNPQRGPQFFHKLILELLP